MPDKKNLFDRIFNDQKFMIATSIITAVAIWFYVVGVYDPKTSKTIKNIPLSSSLNGTAAEQQELMILKGVRATVDVEIDGNRVELVTLAASKITAEVDCSIITAPGKYSLPVNVILPAGNISVATVFPENVDVEIAIKKTVGVMVSRPETKGKVPEGFSVGENLLTAPSIINVTGPEEVVDKIARAVADPIDISAAESTVMARLNFTLYDEDDRKVDMTNLTLDRNQVTVTANVYKMERIPLGINVINSSGGLDEAFVNVEITPKEIDVLISGPTPEIARSISLGVVDMAEVDKDGFTDVFKIIFPNGIKGAGVSEATVKITYPELAVKVFDVSVFEFTPASSRNISANPVKITVRGVAEDISRLNQENIKAIIDVSDVKATGRHQLPVTFVFPSDMKVSVYGKYNTTVTIR